MLDKDLLRQETPACRDLIHFNNAGAALQPRPVTEAVLHHLALEQRIGGYEAAEAGADAAENFYHAFGRLLNCNPREIAYMENATRAWTTLLQSIPFERGDRIITGQSEYASNYMALLHLARTRQVEIVVIDNDSNGQISLDQLSAELDDSVRLIVLTHIPSQSGVIHPAAEVGKLARQHRILYLLDACQSAGQLDLDVNALGCDMLTGSGRKYLRGPRGTGFMYVRHSILDYLKPATLDLHSASWTQTDQYEWRDDARRFEIWEQFVAGKIGLAAAADYATTIGMTAIEAETRRLAGELRDRLNDVPGVILHDQGYQQSDPDRAASRSSSVLSGLSGLSGIVTFELADHNATVLQHQLRQQRINISVIRQKNTRLDFERRGLSNINRASVHYYNTDQEIEQFCDAVRAAT